MDPKEEKMPQIESVDPTKPTVPPAQPEEKKGPIHQIPEESVAKPKKVIVLYPTVILLILISVVAGYLGYQNYQLRNQLKDQVIQTPAPQIPQEAPIPTPDLTADWEVYRNEEYGFEFKYPQGWYSTNCNNPNLLLIHPNGTPGCIDITSGKIAFEIWSDKKNGLINDAFGPNIEKVIQQTQNLDSRIKKYYLSSKDEKLSTESIFYLVDLDSENKLNMLVLEKEDETYSDQILSTFKFLDEERITKEEAVEIVQNRLEVKDYFSNTPNARLVVERFDEENSLWIIHVYETLDGQTTTFSWYEVDSKTGKATDFWIDLDN